MHVEFLYGGSCPEGFFRVAPDCGCPPSTLSPEWLLAQALEEDGVIRNRGRLALLLREAPGPHTVAKAAAVEPDMWEGVLHVALYADAQPCSEECACLLPFAPATSMLAALGRKQACAYAEAVTPAFISSFIQAAGFSGVEKLTLVNPSYVPSRWTKLVFDGFEGYRAASAIPAPRALRYAAMSSIDAEASAGEVRGVPITTQALPQPRAAPKLVPLAFGESWREALALLEEVEASGHLITARALYEIASAMGAGKPLVRKLLAYGYLRVRSGQVELSGKGIYALGQG
ncbi:MAG: hypothetical protein QXS92_03160 [Thermofilum sp.]